MIDGVHIGCPGIEDPSYKLLKLFKPGPR
jgi:hypothetical protein